MPEKRNAIQYNDTRQSRTNPVPWYDLQRLDIPGQADAIRLRRDARLLWQSAYPETLCEETPPQVAFLFTMSERIETREILRSRTNQALHGHVVFEGMNLPIDFVSNVFLS